MTQGKRVALSAAQRTELWSRWKAGQSLHTIGRAFGNPISRKVELFFLVYLCLQPRPVELACLSGYWCDVRFRPHFMSTTGQTPVRSIVIVISLSGGTYGGDVPCEVTAHSGPGGPLQFDRLEAALAARFQELSSKLGDETQAFRHRPKGE